MARTGKQGPQTAPPPEHDVKRVTAEPAAAGSAAERAAGGHA